MDTYDKITDGSCQRMRAASGFIDQMKNKDRTGIVLFTDSANVVSNLSSNSSSLKSALQKITSNGGTDFNSAISKSVSLFDNSKSDKKIILLTDGESSVSDSILKTAKDKNIKIFTIGLGDYSDDSVLKHIANYTGGKFFKAYDSKQLVDIYSEVGFDDDFDKTDNDGDGLYNIVETAGIRLQNGSVIYCDATKPDTDSDGLKDGEEIEPKPKFSNKEKKDNEGNITQVKGYYFEMKSNPNKKDSDGDGINDDKDNHPLWIEVLTTYDEDASRLISLGSASDQTNNVIRNNIWLVDSSYKHLFVNNFEHDSNKNDINNDFKNDLLIIDYSNDKLIDYCVYNSYMYSDYTLITETVTLIKKYNDSLGRTKFQRSIKGMRAEWNEHTYLYLTFGESELGEHAKHVDLDSNADGTPAQIWHDWFN